MNSNRNFCSAVAPTKPDVTHWFLLDKHKTESLPLTISLAIECEVQDIKRVLNDPQLRHHEKKLRKILTAEKGEAQSTKRKLDDLFERPLNAKATALMIKPTRQNRSAKSQ